MKYGFDIQTLIDYLENTPEDSWRIDTVRSKDGKTNCVMGHIFNFGGGDGNIDEYGTNGGTRAWDFFENVWATTYMIYKINDKISEEYPQETPKQRILAYLKNLRDGKEKTTQDYMKEQEAQATKELLQ